LSAAVLTLVSPKNPPKNSLYQLFINFFKIQRKNGSFRRSVFGARFDVHFYRQHCTQPSNTQLAAAATVISLIEYVFAESRS
jgi:hypothetical protein